MKKGFTLIEAVVVISIILILSGMVLLNQRASQAQFALQRSAHKLAQDIRRAKDLAMSTQKFNDEIPEGGYGIYIKLATSDSSYKIYADLNGNEEWNASDGIVETCDLEKKIFIKSVSPSPLSINFKPPDPEVKISQDATSAIIELAIGSDPDNIKTITVNKLGLITIE